MSYLDRAAGYKGVDPGFTPPTLSTEIVLQYRTCALTPYLAKSQFFTEAELFTGSRTIFRREKKLEWFGYDTHNNEDPPVQFGPEFDYDSIEICRATKYQYKLSELDQAVMTPERLNEWVTTLSRQINENIIQEIDSYSIPVILASASPDNVGKHAGQIDHSVDLGGTGGTDNAPLSVTNIEQFVTMFDKLHDVASQAGWTCDAAETELAGPGVTNPVLVIPYKLNGLAKRFIRENELGCNCGPDAVYRNGLIGRNIDGFNVVVSQKLQPIVTASNETIYPVLLCDPSQILHAFKVITDKKWNGKFEDYYLGQYAYDTHVINRSGVIIANVVTA